MFHVRRVNLALQQIGRTKLATGEIPAEAVPAVEEWLASKPAQDQVAEGVYLQTAFPRDGVAQAFEDSREEAYIGAAAEGWILDNWSVTVLPIVRAIVAALTK